MASEQNLPQIGNEYLDTEVDPLFNTFEEMMSFMHEGFRPIPEPKEIKMVVLDADDTMWDIDPWGLATLAIPVGHTGGNELPVRLNGNKVTAVPSWWEGTMPTGVARLEPKLRQTLAKLKERGIPVSIASQNDKRSIQQYVDAFGLRDQIADIEANLSASKDQMVKQIAQRQKVDPAKILFVDNSLLNCEEVETHTRAMALALGYDIETLDQLLEFIK